MESMNVNVEEAMCKLLKAFYEAVIITTDMMEQVLSFLPRTLTKLVLEEDDCVWLFSRSRFQQ